MFTWINGKILYLFKLTATWFQSLYSEYTAILLAFIPLWKQMALEKLHLAQTVVPSTAICGIQRFYQR